MWNKFEQMHLLLLDERTNARHFSFYCCEILHHSRPRLLSNFVREVVCERGRRAFLITEENPAKSEGQQRFLCVGDASTSKTIKGVGTFTTTVCHTWLNQPPP